MVRKGGRGGRKGRRRGGSGGGGGNMVARGGMVEFKSTKDTITVKGHQLFSNFLGTTAGSGGLLGSGNGITELALSVLGQRALAFGELFARYRIKQIEFTYIPIVGSSVNGAIALGIIDDEVDTDNTSTIANYLAVTQLRTSLNTQVWQKSYMKYVPVDPKKWYYTDRVVGSSTTDRFATQVSLAGQATAAGLNGNSGLGSLRMDYVIQYEGAVPLTVDTLTTEHQTTTHTENNTPRQGEQRLTQETSEKHYKLINGTLTQIYNS